MKIRFHRVTRVQYNDGEWSYIKAGYVMDIVSIADDMWAAELCHVDRTKESWFTCPRTAFEIVT